MSSKSIYIPRMRSGWTQEQIQNLMLGFGIGLVTAVDFTPIGKKHGFKETPVTEFKAAFVHFDENYELECQTEKQKETYIKFWNEINMNKSYTIDLQNYYLNQYATKPREHWICLKNRNPIKRTVMNIHQVVENGRYLENLVTSQAEEINSLKEKVDGMQRVIYQLLGGLFCQKTQTDTLDHLVSVLFEDRPYSEYFTDTHPSGSNPTTRQGDENSERIARLESQIAKLAKNTTNTDDGFIPEKLLRFIN